MTVQALKFFHKLKQFAPAHDKKYFDVVEQALEEVEQYRTLGTLEELKDLKEMNEDCTIKHLTGIECYYNETGCSDCKGKQALLEAMEKQIPKKPIIDEEMKAIEVHYWNCPSCKTRYGTGTDMIELQHCHVCGQAIDWGEEE